MRKDIGSICLVAGTAIGAGILALPLVLAGFGLIMSILLMGGIWAIMYYTALVNLELNLRAGEGLVLGALGRKFSGPIAEFLGYTLLKLLSYALLSAYIYGGTAVIQKLLEHSFGINISFFMVLPLYTAALIGILFMKMQRVDYLNRLLFLGLLLILGILMGGILSQINLKELPLLQNPGFQGKAWYIALPTIFTSFGFHVIFHTLTNYCQYDPKILKRAFFWGSLIPLVFYILWAGCVLGVIHHHSPLFYQKMVKGGVEVGELIQQLSHITRWPVIQILSWIGSILAIVTSAIGVGMGLVDGWRSYFNPKINGSKGYYLSLSLTLLPPFFVALLLPNVFVSALGFAGMVLVGIAILLPLYLLYKVGSQGQVFYPLLRYKILQGIALLFGIGIIGCEVLNVMKF